MKQLSEERIREMRTVRDGLAQDYGTRDEMLNRFDEIFFMTRGERPRSIKGVDEGDMKETISSSGRDAVMGLWRILKSGGVHVKVKNAPDPDKIERGLKTMLRVSGESKLAKTEDDLLLSAILYGPGALRVDSLDDLIETQKNTDPDLPKYRNEYVGKQLEMLRKKTPFMFDVVNPRHSYPLFGAWGMTGHLEKYTLKGAEISDRYGVSADATKDYEVRDFFYYTDRLVEAVGISEPLLAAEWVARDKKGEIIGSINIPVFTRFAGGTNLFHEPHKQSQPLLYAKAQGNWDLRENLLFTYLFTAIYQNGLPGPLLLIDPENADQDVEVEYRNGLRTIVAKGRLEDPQVIDGDVLRVKDMLDGASATQTIQPQTLGQNTGGVTFSQFASAFKAGMLPAVDPKESLEALYTDAFRHTLQRIKAENIQNDLIAPADIPDGEIDLDVTIEPDMEQDDLRNAQVAVQLLTSGADVSKEWVNTNILKIADSQGIWREKKREEIRDAIVELMKTPEVLSKYLPQNRQQKQKPSQQPPAGAGAMPTEAGAPEMGNVPGMEQMPQTDAMIPPEERA